MTDADLVVLSLLAEQPRHGYDIDQVLVQRGYREWTELAFSSIYYVLKRLYEREWVRPLPGQTGRRTVFELTPTGHRELRRAAGERAQAPDRPSASVLPALGGYARLDDPRLLDALRRRAAALTEQIATLTRAREATGAPHARAVFGYEIHRLEADLAWTTDLLDRPAPPHRRTTRAHRGGTHAD